MKASKSAAIPYVTNHRLYSDQKPGGQLFVNGSDPYRFDGTCELDGMPTSCDLVQRLMTAGALGLKIGTGPSAQIIPIDSYGLGILRSRYWKPKSGRPKPAEGTPGAWGDAGIWTE